MRDRAVREETLKRDLPEAVTRTDEQLHAENARGVRWRPIAEVFVAARGDPPTELAIKLLVDELKTRLHRYREKRYGPTQRVVKRRVVEQRFFEDDDE